MTSCTNAPAGSLPYGYHIVDFSERFTNAGAEASVTYIGPSISRFAFLGEIFGYWMAANDPITNECCVCLGKAPCAYPYIMNASEVEGREHFGEYTCTYGEGHDCLWPDTFTIQRESPTAIPLKMNCVDEEIPECNKPLYYGSLDAEDEECECYCEIVINFRHKNHAKWPRIFEPCDRCGPTGCVWSPPEIPEGTFVDVRMDGFASARLIKAASLKFSPTNYYPWLYDHESTDTDGCKRKRQYPTGETDPRFDWYTTPSKLSPDDEMYPSRLIQTVNLEVTWSNVPLYNKALIGELTGCVNDTVFLGYPPQSVLFLGADPVIRGVWGCNEVYDITYKFIISTTPLQCPSLEDNLNDGHFNEEALLILGVFDNQIGIWNSIWSETPMHLTYTTTVGEVETEHKVCCTNWVPIVFATDDCCEDDDCANCKIYPVACLERLFTLATCTSCYEDCPESWPDCAFSG